MTQIRGGIFVWEVPKTPTFENLLMPGERLTVKTEKTTYTIEKRALRKEEQGEAPEFLVWGHPLFCPRATKAYINGSLFPESRHIRWGWVGVGLQMEMILLTRGEFNQEIPRALVTSKILEITK